MLVIASVPPDTKKPVLAPVKRSSFAPSPAARVTVNWPPATFRRAPLERLAERAKNAPPACTSRLPLLESRESWPSLTPFVVAPAALVRLIVPPLWITIGELKDKRPCELSRPLFWIVMPPAVPFVKLKKAVPLYDALDPTRARFAGPAPPPIVIGRVELDEPVTVIVPPCTRSVAPAAVPVNTLAVTLPPVT